jgi:hypothetical protein
MSVKTRIITPSLRCSEIGPLVITSRYIPPALALDPLSSRSPSQKDAIQYSWDVLTKVYKLDKDRLYVTYFEGDQKTGLEPDLEARQLWLDVGVAESHVIPGSAKDNFWGMDLLTRP